VYPATETLMQSYRDLDIYKLAHSLAIEIHKLSLQLPNFEMYEICSQIRRSSKSISANIVEGYGRKRYNADFVRFLIFAHASCDETMEWLNYINELYPEFHESVNNLIKTNEELGRKMNRFISSVEKMHNIYLES
jgi:four helix bundle protein